MSNYKNGRLSKKNYLLMLENDRKSEKSCHKKKNKFISKFTHELKCSRDS